MPVYDYRCPRGHFYEKTEGFSAPARQKCPECGAVAQRQISLPAVIFKGSGFYSTDNRRSSTETSPASSSESSSNGHGDSKDDGGHSHPHEGGESKVAAAATDD